MSIGITAVPFQKMIDNFSKQITKVPIIKVTDNYSGDETLTEDDASILYGAFYKSTEITNQEYMALLDNADALLIVKPDVVIEKNDIIIYPDGAIFPLSFPISFDQEKYRIDHVPILRLLAGTPIYRYARLFKVE